MIQITDLPAVNATLNATSAIFLTVGYVLIRRGRVIPHKRCMLSALAASTLFLISYVIYHANTGSRPFSGIGAVRYVYFSILITHVVLAATIPDQPPFATHPSMPSENQPASKQAARPPVQRCRGRLTQFGWRR